MILLDIQRIIFPIIIILSGFYLILLLCKSIFHLFFPKKPKIHSAKNRIITITPTPTLVNKLVESKEEKEVIVPISTPKKKKKKTSTKKVYKSKRSKRSSKKKRN